MLSICHFGVSSWVLIFSMYFGSLESWQYHTTITFLVFSQFLAKQGSTFFVLILWLFHSFGVISSGLLIHFKVIWLGKNRKLKPKNIYKILRLRRVISFIFPSYLTNWDFTLYRRCFFEYHSFNTDTYSFNNNLTISGKTLIFKISYIFFLLCHSFCVTMSTFKFS